MNDTAIATTLQSLVAKLSYRGKLDEADRAAILSLPFRTRWSSATTSSFASGSRRPMPA